MNKSYRRILTLLGAVAMTFGAALPALAGLGGNAASIAADSLALRATVQATSQQAYDVHEFTTDAGVAIREYLNRSGRVFAVTWSGPVMPDFAVLLGSHFDEYAAALADPRAGTAKSLDIDTAALVLRSGGHLRAYSGLAYLPALLPAGTPPAELR